MQRCWLDDPQARPAFSELVSTLSRMLESIADYTEVCMRLPEPQEIPAERNPGYGIEDPIPVKKNPVYRTSSHQNGHD